jgi:hypothetical protein
MHPQDEKNLTRRYLTWLYKTTREAFDRVERKFTQTAVDKAILSRLEKEGSSGKIENLIEDWKQYVRRKEHEGLDLKFDGAEVRPEHRFNELKLEAIEEIILAEFGEKGLAEIKEMYEREMTERIMHARDHDR